MEYNCTEELLDPKQNGYEQEIDSCLKPLKFWGFWFYRINQA